MATPQTAAVVGPSSPPVSATTAANDAIEARLSAALESSELEDVVDKPAAASRDFEPKKPKKKEPEPEPEEADEDDVEDDAGVDPEGNEDADANDEEVERAEPKRGSKETPYTVKDLPEDVFFELKVDGKKMTVSAADLGKSYIGEQTINRRINATKQLYERAEAAVTKSREYEQRFSENFNRFTLDPVGMFTTFFGIDPGEIPELRTAKRHSDNRPLLSIEPKSRAEAAELFAELTANLSILERTPGKKEQREAMVERRRVEKERERLEEAKRTEQAQRAQAEANQKALEIFKPGFADGLKRAGFPAINKATHAKVMEELLPRIKQRAQTKIIDSDDVAELTLRSIRRLQEDGVISKAKANKPKPVERPAFGRAEARGPGARPATSGGKNPWEGVPQHKRANDPDFLLRKTRQRDFVR